MEDEDILFNDEESTDQSVDQELEKKRLIESAKSVMPVGNTTDDEELTTKSFAAQMVEDFVLPVKTSALESKDKFWDTWGDKYIKQFGGDEGKAKEEADKVYALVSKEYENLAFKEQELTVLENMSYMFGDRDDINYIGEGYTPTIGLEEQTVSGRATLINEVTDATRDPRGVALDSHKFIDYKGDLVDYQGNAYDLAHEDKYANKDGRTIKAFVYEPVDDMQTGGAYIRAIYEGEDIPTDREVVSRLDTADTFLRANNLQNSIWRVATGSVTDFLLDVADTALAISKYTNSLITLGNADSIGMNDWIESSRDYLGTWMQSKSRADQEDWFTMNNAVNMGINIGLQLLMGKAIASVGSKILGMGSKAAAELAMKQEMLAKTEAGLASAITKTEKKLLSSQLLALDKEVAKATKLYNTRANVIKRFSLFSMGAMQAKATADEAENLGYGPAASAAIFFASLGTMMWVNKLSDLGFERLGLEVQEKVTKESAKEILHGLTPATTKLGKLYSKIIDIAENTSTKFRSAMTKIGPVPSNIIQESVEENGEFFFDQLVRHTANAVSYYGYDDENRPKSFLSVSDPGYWKMVMNESIMNTIGGAFGGAMGGIGEVIANGMPKGVNEDELLQKGNAAENLRKIGYNATRTVKGKREYKLFKDHMKKLRKKGATGREDISTKWLDEENRYKRTDELTDEDRKQGHTSQADFTYKATLAQLEYYKDRYANTSKKLQELVAEDQDFGFLLESETLYEESKKLFKEKADLYAKANVPNGVNLDDDLDALYKEKKKIKPDKDGNIDDTKYQDKLSKISEVTGLEQSEIEHLIEVNKEIKDIGSGAAAQLMFIKHEASKDRYKYLNYKLFKNIIESDTDAQEKFKQVNSEWLKYQEDISKAVISDITANNGVLSTNLIESLLDEDNTWALNDEAKTALLTAIDQLGTSLTKKKSIIVKSIMENNKDLLDGFNRDKELLRYLGLKGINTDEVMTKLFQVIDEDPNAAIERLRKYKEDDDLGKLLNSSMSIEHEVAFQDRIEKAKEGELPGLDAMYLLAKVFDVLKQKDFTSLETMKFDRHGVYRSKTNLAYTINSMLTELGGRVYDALVEGSLTLSESSGKLMDEVITKSDKEKGITYEQKLEGNDYKKKKALINAVNAIRTVHKETVRNDLMHGIEINEAGKVKASNESLLQKYNDILNSPSVIKDENDNVKYFSDPESAKDLIEQINVRLDENIFLANSLRLLAKLDYIHKNRIGNDGTPETFLTTYLDKYIIDLSNIEDGYEVLAEELKSNINTLEALKSALEELLTKSDNADETLKEIYVGDAIKTLYGKSKHILTFINNADKDALDDEFLETFDKVRGILNNVDDSISVENIGAIAETNYQVKKLLHELYKNNEGDESFLKKIAELQTVNNKPQFRTFVLFMLEPAAEVQKVIRGYTESVAEAAKSNANSLLTAELITMPQISWVEEISTIATNKDYLKIFKLSSLSSDTDEYIAVFSGLQGTGKTRVVADYSSKVISEVLNKNKVDPDMVLKPLFVGNKVKQSQALIDAASVEAATIDDKGKKTTDQKELYNLFLNDVDAIHSKLRNVGVIIYDEIGHLEYITNEKVLKEADGSDASKGVLNLILEKLDKVNKKRVEEGLPAISIIGLGDSQQPGFILGSKSARHSKGIEKIIDFTPIEQNPFSAKSVYKSNVTLNRNFRSKIVGSQELIHKLEEVLTNIMINTSGERVKITYPTFKYDKKDGVHKGFRFKNRTFTELLNDIDLYNDIKSQIETSEKQYKKTGNKKDRFTVLLVSGDNTFDEALLEGTKIGELVNEHKDNFSLLSFYDVQGDEANYVLADIDPNFFLDITQEDLEKGDIGKDKRPIFVDRVKRLSMLLGRAYTFTDLAYKANNIHLPESVEEEVKMVAPDVTLDFKKQWLSILLDNIIQDTESVEKTSEEKKAPITKSVKKDPSKKDTVVGLDEGVITTGRLITSMASVNSNTITKSDESIINDVIESIRNILIGTGVDINPSITANNLNSDDLKNLVDKLKNRRKVRRNQLTIDELTDIDRAISFITDILHTAYDSDKNNDLEKDISELFSKGSTTALDRTDAEYMKDVEKKGKMVMYSHFEPYTTAEESKTRAKELTKYIYGEEHENNFHGVNGIIDYDGGDIKINTDDYDFYIVTYYQSHNGTLGHVLVAKTKDSNKTPYLIAKLPDVRNYDSTSKIKHYFEEREKFLVDNLESDVVDLEHDTYRLESKVEVPELLITGMTIGNVLEASRSIKGIMKDMPDVFDPKDIDNRSIKKVFRSKTIDQDILNNLTLVKAESKNKKYKIWDLEKLKNSTKAVKSFPFIKFTDTKFAMKYNGDTIVIVKTAKGNVPFLLKGSKQLPIIGLYDGKVVTDDRTVSDPDSEYFDQEFKEVSYHLNGLKSKLDSSVIVEDDGSRIKQVLDDNQIIDNTELTEESAKLRLLHHYRSLGEAFLGNMNIPVSKAKKLWTRTGRAKSISRAYTVMRGEHAGKAVMFYTFRNDVKLGDLSRVEFEALYAKMIRYKNNNESDLTDNRSGIGMVLLDAKGQLLSDIIKKRSNKKETTIDFNKIVMSGKAEKSMLSLLAQLHNKFVSEQNNIADQILEQYGDEYNHKDAVNSWYEATKEKYKDSEEKFNSITTALEVVLDRIFEAGNTGYVTVTTRVNSAVTRLLTAVQITNKDSNLSDEQKTEAIKAAIAAESPSDLGQFAGLSIPELVSLTMDTQDGENATGVLLLNNKGKLVLSKNKDTVITAVDRTWVTDLQEDIDEGALPEPHIDIATLSDIFNNLIRDDGALGNIFDDVLTELDVLLLNTRTFVNGIYVSPLSETTSSYLGEILSESAEDELMTTVKQFRNPAIVLNIDSLSNDAIVEPFEEVTKEEDDKRRGSAYDLHVKKVNATKKEDLSKLYNDISSSTLSDEDKKTLFKQIQDRFNKLTKVTDSWQEDLGKYGFDHFILRTEETSDAIDMLDLLYNIIDSENKAYTNIWNSTLIDIQDIINDNPMLVELIGKLANETPVVTPQHAFKYIKDNTRKIGTINKLEDNEVSSLINSISYPIKYDTDPLRKARITANEGSYTENSLNIVKQWIDNIFINTTKRIGSIELDSLLSYSPADLAAALHSFEDIYLVEMLDKLHDDVKDISYNKEGYEYFVSKLSEFINTYVNMNIETISEAALKAFTKLATKMDTKLKIYKKDINMDIKVKNVDDIMKYLAVVDGQLGSVNDKHFPAITTAFNKMIENGITLEEIIKYTSDRNLDEELENKVSDALADELIAAGLSEEDIMDIVSGLITTSRLTDDIKCFI